ncbi:MAG: ABC transporter permease, partial [Candidatus Acidiferrales bacterium]
MLSDILIRVRALMRRDDVERELDEELRFHFEEQVEKFVKEGVPRDEARRRARLEFGGAELIKEECREARGVHFVETLAQDVHYALRMMRKSPGVMAVIVISLALGVGANTAIFSVVDGLLMRPLPVAAPDQITVLAVQQKDAPVGSSGFSYPELIDFRRQAGAFSDVFGVVLGSVQVTVDDSPDQCFANYVTGNFFSSLGMKPTLGRLILPSEGETPGEPAIAVLDYAYWERRFNGDPGVVGGRVRVNGKSARIIGVAPSQFHGMFSLFETDVYLPMSSVSLEESAGAFWTSRDRRRILAFGRLKPGISLREAQSSLDVITARLANQYPATDRWFTIRAVPEKSARPIPYANNSFVAMSGLFLLLAACVLLLACMNVENILLARGTAREREMGIRAALGAGRARLICQMLTESILLAILGGGGGIVLGVWANHWTNSLRFQNIPLQVDSALDWRVFTFAAASVLFTGIFVGLLPALRASSGDVNSALHEGAQRDSQGIHLPGFRNILVIAQAAVSLALLVAAGLLVRSLQKVEGFDLGFDPGHLLNVIMDPHEAGYGDAQTTLFYREIEARVRALPGVQSASFASYVPMGGFPSKASVSLEGRPIRPDQKAPGVLFNCVDPAYFQTMRIA